MDHEQKHQEKHRLERQEKQTHERESEKQFSKPGPTVRPLWFLVGGILLTVIALFIWMRLYAGGTP
jgi:hypothetical protein